MKMYILIKENVPAHMAPVIAAHASLACFKKYENDADMQQWFKVSFKKVVCSVNDKEFILAQKENRHLVLTESSLGNKEVAIVFVPRPQFSKSFQYFRMWKPHHHSE